MENSIAYPFKNNIRSVIIDAGALAFIYFVPAVSHILNLPVYLFEPMRIMLFVSFAFTSRSNSYLIALGLPFFSFLISSHPSLFKSVIIAAELCLNVYLFYWIAGKVKDKFTPAILSMILSKLVYYILKFALLSFVVIEGELISTPLYIQLVVVIMLSVLIQISSISGIGLLKKK